MSTTLVALLAAAVAAVNPAPAGKTRVAVAPFVGPELITLEARAVVVDLVAARHALIPDAELQDARTVAGIDGSERTGALTIARLTGAEAVVIGRVGVTGEAYALGLSVLRVATGENIGAVLVPLQPAGVTPAARQRIDVLLSNLLAEVEPQVAPPGPGSPVPPTAAIGQRDRAAVDAKREKRTEGAQRSKWRLPIAFEAAVGLSATARRLDLSQEAGLATDASIASTPSPGLRLEVEAATVREPGLGIMVSLDRSIGARVALGESGVELPVTQMQWGLGLRGRMRFRKHWVPFIALGYSELTYEVGQSPSDAVVPNARYSFLEAGAGLRYELGTAFAGFGSARYLRPLTTSGITDPNAFGGASVSGLAADAGFEIELLEAILLRAGVRYTRFVLDFEGSGDLAVALDEDLGQDVMGAVDAFIGGYGQAVFRF